MVIINIEDKKKKTTKSKFKNFLIKVSIPLIVGSSVYFGNTYFKDINENYDKNSPIVQYIENYIKTPRSPAEYLKGLEEIQFDKESHENSSSLENLIEESFDSELESFLEDSQIETLKTDNYSEKEIQNTEKILPEYSYSEMYLKDVISRFLPMYNDYEKEQFIEEIDQVYNIVAENTGVEKALYQAVGNYNAIKKYSNMYDVPIEVSIGIMLIESGGRRDAYSHTGNAGLYQLSPYLAKHYGLKINGEIDERLMPEKSIETGIKYISRLKERFGRLDLAILAYHQGETNVGNMVKDYVNKNYDSDYELKDIWPPVVEEYDVNVLKILNDEEIKESYFDLNYKLNGTSYVYKVFAAVDFFANFLDNTDKVDVTSYKIHKVQESESLYSISKKYSINTDSIINHNPWILDPNKIKVDSILYIPVGTRELYLDNIKEDYFRSN